MPQRPKQRSYDDRHGPRRGGRNRRSASEKKPSLRERSAELGIFAIRRQLLEPATVMSENQERVAERIGRRSGKVYEIGSAGMTLVGLNNYPDQMFRPAKYRSLTTEQIIDLLESEYGAGASPVEAHPTGRVILLSKNERATRQKIAIELNCPSNNIERLAIERIISDARLGDKLKSFGISAPVEHLTIGHVDVRQISDAEYANPELLLNPIAMRDEADYQGYEIPDKMIFDQIWVPGSRV